MSSNWRETTWGDEISLEYGKGIRGYQNADGPVPVFGTNGQVGWTDEPLAPGPGIIVGRKGAYRGIHYSKSPFFVIDTAYYVRPKSLLDMRWLYYAMVHHQLGSIDDGSPIPSTTRAAVYVREFKVPDADVQESVAKILGDLDDKIDVLREVNQSLENIARAVFRAWFVDFEPVRAKAAGARSFRGMPQDLFDVLPDAFEESEFGEVPRGWHPCVLADLVEVNPTRSLRRGELSSYLEMSNVPTEGPSAQAWAEREFTSGMRFRNGDTLLARITPCLENGKTALVDFLKDGEIGWGSTEFIVLAPKAGTPCEFIYCLARDTRFREFAIKNMTGTSGRQRVDHSSISGFYMVHPGTALLEEFGRIAGPLFKRIVADRDEIGRLSNLRDVLLPKLISGELEAPSLEALGLEAVSDGG